MFVMAKVLMVIYNYICQKPGSKSMPKLTAFIIVNQCTSATYEAAHPDNARLRLYIDTDCNIHYNLFSIFISNRPDNRAVKYNACGCIMPATPRLTR
jgi:hypothetical protein